MNRIERLMNEYGNMNYAFRSDMPEGLSGLIVQTTIYLRPYETEARVYTTLAEELGHYETSSNKDVTNYDKYRKEELRAREWGYKKIIPTSDFERFKSGEQVHDYYVSDELDLPIDVVRGAYDMYKRKGVL